MSRIIMFNNIDRKTGSSPEFTKRGSPGGSPSQIEKSERLEFLYAKILLMVWRRILYNRADNALKAFPDSLAIPPRCEREPRAQYESFTLDSAAVSSSRFKIKKAERS